MTATEGDHRPPDNERLAALTGLVLGEAGAVGGADRLRGRRRDGLLDPVGFLRFGARPDQESAGGASVTAGMISVASASKPEGTRLRFGDPGRLVDLVDLVDVLGLVRPRSAAPRGDGGGAPHLLHEFGDGQLLAGSSVQGPATGLAVAAAAVTAVASR